MKKLVFALLLSSTVGFAVNPKKIVAQKNSIETAIVVKKEMDRKLISKVSGSNCYGVWIDTLRSCIISGMSLDDSYVVACGAQAACQAITASLAGQ